MEIFMAGRDKGYGNEVLAGDSNKISFQWCGQDNEKKALSITEAQFVDWALLLYLSHSCRSSAFFKVAQIES